MATVDTLITAEEFWSMLDDGQPYELVKGRLVPVNMPAPRHGFICSTISGILRDYLKLHDLGRVVSNDSGIITRRNPDSVRGADVAFYSFKVVPKGPFPEGYLHAPPELVFEVCSPSDRMVEILEKVAEYLKAGVHAVCVVDSEEECATVFTADRGPLRLGSQDCLRFPKILPGFDIPVREMFEG